MYVIYDILKTANFCVVILRTVQLPSVAKNVLTVGVTGSILSWPPVCRILDEIVDRETARDGGRALDSLIFPCDERGSHLDRQNS